MSEALVIFPHQLFRHHPGLQKDRPVYLVEDPWFFADPERQLRFRPPKLILHRASLQAYRDLLRQQGYLVRYLEFRPAQGRSGWWARFQEDGIRELSLCDPVEQGLMAAWRREAAKTGLQLRVLATPMFLCSPTEIRDFFQGQKKFRQTAFYIQQRRQRGILLTAGKPLGGRWTYDTLNRKRLPPGLQVPRLPDPDNEPYVSEAKAYVARTFPGLSGYDGPFIYPVTQAAAEKWLEHFLTAKLSGFGPYQDAMSAREPYLFHSLLSPLLNLGLLTPAQVLTATLEFANHQPLPLNSLEGFVRQILGWREYVRALYLLVGEQQRAANFWGHHRKLPQALYTGTTGLLPVDTVISRLLATGYAHHIERLMILGNFMLLAEIEPQEVYRWFMEMFIDAYDWVMVPNVFGMSQFADGGLTMTKPYLSAAHYLLRLSDYPPGPWCEVWNGLFWRFVHQHQDYFQHNPRLLPLVRTWARFSPGRRQELLQAATKFLAELS